MSDEAEAAVESNVVDSADSEAFGAESRVFEDETGNRHTVASFTDQDLFALKAEEREARASNRDGDDLGWSDLREGRRSRKADTEELEQGDTEAIEAAMAEDTPPQKEIKKPWGRLRRLEKERNEAKQEARKVTELEQKVERLTAMLERQLAPNEDGDVEMPPDPQIAPVQAILSKLEETQKELRSMKEEREREKQLSEARSLIEASNHRLNTSIEADPVFKGAFNHITKVVLNNVRDDPRFGATETERRMNAMEQLIRKQLDWQKNGLDPVEEVYKQAIKFGFDPDAAMEQLGGSYDENGNWISTRAQQAPSRPTGKPVQKPKSPAEKIAAARARTANTASIAGAVGRPVKSFNVKKLEGMTDEQQDYEIRKAIDNGELPPGRFSKYVPDLRSLLEDTAAVWDDGT